MEGKQGYSITTYRFRLYRKHMEWFVSTKELYCQVAGFYLRLISDRQFYALPDYEMQRKTEVLTQGNKKAGIEAECPLPFEKVPLYFRRAALREAAAVARSYRSGNSGISGTEVLSVSSKMADETIGTEKRTAFPKALNTSPVYYKGMYRNLDLPSRWIELKLYTGTEWRWDSYRFSTDKREVPEGAELMSPTIKIEGKQVFLHFPVKQLVEDIRTVKERAGERYLAVSFQLGEVFAACVAETPGKSGNGDSMKLAEVTDRCICMMRGGKEFCHRRRALEERLWSSLISDTENTETVRTGHIRKKLRDLMKGQAHRVSREIVDFAVKEDCKVIAVPDYQGSLGLNRKPYLPSSDYDWIGRRIIEYTAYKGFQKGIVLCRIPVKGISEKCSRCGEKIRRYNEGHKPRAGYLGGRLYVCPNGHRGNTAVNTAENVGKRYRELYGRVPYGEKESSFSKKHETIAF